ncbi:MAG: tetratricopeptide repeat protein [Bryobacteraceae bacterium]|nr:tetratricopeptide repeat protein [Bryobacteraceae bacterium]
MYRRVFWDLGTTLDGIGSAVAGSTGRVLALVFGLMVLLFLATGFLTGAYRRERESRAAVQFEAAQELARDGKYGEAIDHYTEALVLARDRLEYMQALARVLVEAKKTREAETYLLELIRRDPPSGAANLMLARINADRNDFDAAVRHYQRAIYGRWPDAAPERRINVRSELIDVLLRQGRRSQVEAELLRQKDELPDDPELKKRLGRMFLQAHWPEQARDVFTDAVRLSPRDAAALAGLGDAEFQLAQYQTARDAYRRALRIDPEDAGSRARMETANEVVNLNPMRLGLTPANRLARSRALLARVLAEFAFCLPAHAGELPEETKRDVARANEIAAGKVRRRAGVEGVEENVSLAVRLREAAIAACGSPPAEDVAVELVLKKLVE